MSPALSPSGRSPEPGAGRLDAPPATWSWAICPPTGAVTETAQPTSSSASAWGTKTVNTRSRMPSTVHRSQLQTPRQLPYLFGRCTQSYSVAHRTAAARSWKRGTCSRRFRPARCGGAGRCASTSRPQAAASHSAKAADRHHRSPTVEHTTRGFVQLAPTASGRPASRYSSFRCSATQALNPIAHNPDWGGREAQQHTEWIRARTQAHVPPLNRFSHDFREAIRSVISACFEHFDDLPYSHAPLFRVGAVHPAGCHFCRWDCPEGYLRRERRLPLLGPRARHRGVLPGR